MIARQHVQDIQAAISLTTETDVNTPYTLAAEFETIVCDQLLPVIPEPNLEDDSDQVGDGTEGPKDPRPGKTPPSQLTIGAKLNNVFVSRLMKRHMAGTFTNDLIATGVYDHNGKYQTRLQGRIPLFTTVPLLLGGADPILSSMVVNTVNIAQQGTEDPHITFELMGSGHYREFRDVRRIQVITITGTPAGGSVIFNFDGQPLTIAFDDTAGEVLTALEGLSNVAPGDVSVSGGPLPATPIVITFLTTGAWANEDVPLITVTTNSLTGGTTPAAAVTSQVPYLTLPTPPSYIGRYMHPVALTATLNNGDVVPLNDAGLLNHQISMTQNLEWTSLPGVDQFIVPSNKRSGTYMGLVSRGDRQVRPQFDLYLDSSLEERYWKRKNLSITSLKFKHEGEAIATVSGTTYYHAFELEIPLSKPMSLSIESGGNWGAKRVSLLPVWQSSDGFLKFRSRDGSATLL